MKIYFHENGLTLLEMLLALAIAALILIMGFRLILFWQKQMTFTEVNYNIDTLFKSQQAYYNAQCFGIYVPGNAKVADAPNGENPWSGYQYASGRLTPMQFVGNAPVPNPVNNNSFYYPGSVANLIERHYLAGNPSNPDNFPFAPSPIVKDVTQTYQGYKVLHGYSVFFAQILQKRMQQIAGTSTPVPIGVNAVTYAGVSIWLAAEDQATRQADLQLLGGSCLSSLPASNCQNPVANGQFLVWVRPANAPSQHHRSDTWVSNPQVTQFQQLYTTYPITYLTAVTPTTNIGSNNDLYFQYFLCTN